jgi:anthranilate phosphoribosyltransferase
MWCAPNDEVIEAQKRVCTGPKQSRPLTGERDSPDPKRILDLILKTVSGEILPGQAVSYSQIGAYLAAMCIRRTFDDSCNWSPAEENAFAAVSNLLKKLPPGLKFLLDGKGKPDCSHDEMAVVEALRIVLVGRHLDYAQTKSALSGILSGQVRPEWSAALLIGQRMNIENDEEVSAYLDVVLPVETVWQLNIPSITHLGSPFDGSLRYFRPNIFIAAVRAALGRPTVLHGVDLMPPKNGITDEQMLKYMGANVDISIKNGSRLLSRVGLVYISQRSYAPSLYELRDLRVHIAKRPPWSTTEKAQQIYKCSGRNCIVLGFYHTGYEQKLLRLVRDRGFDAGLVIKGEEGGISLGLRLGKPTNSTRKAVNYCEGFVRSHRWSEDVEPKLFDMNYEQSPRAKEVSVEAFVREGMDALGGCHGPAYDKILLNSGMIDYHLGFCESASEGIQQARKALDSGSALSSLNRYIDVTNELK